MEEEIAKKEKKKIYKRLRNKYRLLIMNVDTFEEKFSIILSPLNVFTWGGLSVILISVFFIFIIAFTPLREFIPGYADLNMKRMANYAAVKADSLELELERAVKYMGNLSAILEGRETDDYLESTKQNADVRYDTISLSKSTEDSLLRAMIENEDRYALSITENRANPMGVSSFFFFPPVKGVVTASFNAKTGHYGVDVAAPENEPVKAVLDGTVVLSAWTSETGHVLQIQHANNLISVYKHNAVNLKKSGESVKAGEAIAIIGNSGELSTGPHLHFELWYQGKAIDPQEYITF